MSNWLDSSNNANKIMQTYIQGFLDISGGNVFVRNGNTYLYKSLFVTNDISLNGNLNLGINTNINGNLILSGNTTISGNLFILKDSSMNANLVVGGNTTISGNLLVIRDVSFNANLVVGGNTTLKGNLFVIRDSSMNANLVVGGNTQLNGNLIVSNRAIFDSTNTLNSDYGLSIISNSLAVSSTTGSLLVDKGGIGSIGNIFCGQNLTVGSPILNNNMTGTIIRSKPIGINSGTYNPSTSSNGQVIAYSITSGGIYISTNGGSTFPIGIGISGTGFASISYSGEYLLISSTFNALSYYSTNSGTSNTQITSPSYDNAQYGAISGDGFTMVLYGGGGQINGNTYIATNSNSSPTGTYTFTYNSNLTRPKQTINNYVLSNSGQYHLVVSKVTPFVQVSSTSGTAFSSTVLSGLSNITSVTTSFANISSSGQYQVVGISNNGIYYSSNYGQTWNKSASLNGSLLSLTSNFTMSTNDITGQYLFVISSNILYGSNNFGQTWIVVSVTISGVTSSTITYSGVALSSNPLQLYVGDSANEKIYKASVSFLNPNNLQVIGNTILNGYLSVNNDSSMNSSLTVGGNTTISGNLTVSNRAIFDSTRSTNSDYGLSIISNSLSTSSTTGSLLVDKGGIGSVGNIFCGQSLTMGSTTLNNNINGSIVVNSANGVINPVTSTNGQIYGCSDNSGGLTIFGDTPHPPLLLKGIISMSYSGQNIFVSSISTPYTYSTLINKDASWTVAQFASGSPPNTRYSAISGDGSKVVLYGDVSSGYTYINNSYDVQATVFSQNVNLISRTINNYVLSNTGQYHLVVSTVTPFVKVSSTSGTSFSSTVLSGLSSITSVTTSFANISSSGQYQVVGISANGIYYSSNYGLLWNKSANLTDLLLNSALYPTVSTNDITGQYLFVISSNTLYGSSNYGMSWKPITVTITAQSSSPLSIAYTGIALSSNPLQLLISDSSNNKNLYNASVLISNQNNLQVIGNTILNGYLSLIQDASMNSNLVVGGNLIVKRNINGTAGAIISGGLTTTEAITASGLITANGGLTVASGQTLTLTGATLFGLTGYALTASPTFTGTTTTGAITSSGLITANGGLTVASGQTSTGAITASGLITANSGLTVASGQTTSTGAITASGLITATAGLTVTGGVPQFTNDINVNGITVGEGNFKNNNVCIGQYGLASNISGGANSAIGFTALINNVSGYGNTAIGFRSLYDNSGGSYNIGIGLFAGRMSDLGTMPTGGGASNNLYCTFLGMYTSTGGTTSRNYSTAIGYGATITADHQIMLGTSAEIVVIPGRLTVSGQAIINNIPINRPGNYPQNIAIGTSALSQIGGSNNGLNSVAVGDNALEGQTTGGDNTGFGMGALRENQIGRANTAIGFYSLSKARGQNNTAIGHNSGYVADGSYNSGATNVNYCTFLGMNTGTADSISTYTNSTAIGYGAKLPAGASNQIMLGTTTETVVVPGNLTVNNNVITGSLITCVGLTTTGAITATNQTVACGAITSSGNMVLGINNITTVGSITSTGLLTGVGLTTTGAITATGQTIRSGAITSTGLLTGVGLTTTGAITATGQTIGSGAITSTGLLTGVGLTTTGAITATGQTIASGAITASGRITANGGLTVASGQTTSTGAITASGLITATAGLTVTGVPQFTNDISVNGITVGQGNYLDPNRTNVCVGKNALANNTTGSNNIAIGYQALYTSTGSTNNVAIGAQALYKTTTVTSQRNCAVGLQALYENTTGSQNSAFGAQALAVNTIGYNNVAIGLDALNKNTIGNQNTAIGTEAGNAPGSFSGAADNTNCTFLGSYTNTGGSTKRTQSTAIGHTATITADYQIMLGTTAETVVVPGNLTVNNNVTTGSLITAKSGTNNAAMSFLNAGAGNKLTIYPNLAVEGGYNPTTFANDIGLIFDNNINSAVALNICPWNSSASGLRLSTTGTAGNFTAAVTGKLTVTGTTTSLSFNASSDYRLKSNVLPLTSNFTVDNLKPVSYHFKDSTKKDIGFLAHEVQEQFPFLVSGEKDGENMQSINYNGFIGILVKEMQDSKKEMQDSKKEMQDSKKEIQELKKQIDEMQLVINVLLSK